MADIKLISGATNVIGTDDNDNFIADGNSKGNFTIDGGNGTDTVDYSQLGQTVTLAANGVVNKGGGFGSDTVKNVEGFIGANGQTNTIDGTTNGGPVSFNIDLSNNNLTLVNTTGGPISFNVKNFSNVIGTNNNDTIKGDDRYDNKFGPRKPDNVISGGAGNDTFIGTKGNDDYNGGSGTNTLDYSQLGEKIALTADTVYKGNFGRDGSISAGIDKTLGINKYIGAIGQKNSIDSSITSDTFDPRVSFNIDLSRNTLTLENLPGGPQTFEVVNFTDVRGTNNNDIIKGNDGDNNISGGAGNDIFVGTKGNDSYTGNNSNNNYTLDYSKLGTGITLSIFNQSFASIDKGASGKDNTVGNINKYIGAEGQTNTIDGTTTDAAGSFNIDLSKNSLKIDGFAGGQRAVEVINFSNVVGTNNNDTIVGNGGDNKLTGGKGNDILTGGNGKDILNGTNNNARGVGEVDTLTGGGGADTFVLGDKNGAFYLGNGKNDYALINDFDLTQDRIQLGGNKDLLSVKFDRKSGTIDLFSKQNGGKDLVAKVKLANPFNFSSKSELMGMGNAKTAIAANSVMDGDTSLAPTSIGNDMSSIEGLFVKSIMA